MKNVIELAFLLIYISVLFIEEFVLKFKLESNSKLSVALGKDITGDKIIIDIAKMLC